MHFHPNSQVLRTSTDSCLLPGVAYIQVGELEEHIKDIDVLVMTQHSEVDSGKPVVKHQGRPVVCLNPKCRGNHFLWDCNKTSN